MWFDIVMLFVCQQLMAEQQEEYISNTLLKKIEALKNEKEQLARNYEQEEEFLTNDLSRKLLQVTALPCWTFIKSNLYKLYKDVSLSVRLLLLFILFTTVLHVAVKLNNKTQAWCICVTIDISLLWINVDMTSYFLMDNWNGLIDT